MTYLVSRRCWLGPLPLCACLLGNPAFDDDQEAGPVGNGVTSGASGSSSGTSQLATSGVSDSGGSSGTTGAFGCSPADCPDNAGCVAGACVCDLGFLEGDNKCVRGIAMQSLRWDLPCIEDDCGVGTSCLVQDNSIAELVLSGRPNQRYLVELRVRGVVVLKPYTGGNPDGPWQAGGEPSADGWNISMLEVSDPAQVFFLNYGVQNAEDGVFALDYTQQIEVDGTARLTLTGDSVDNCALPNADSNGEPVVIPNIPPAPAAFEGQFTQVDIVSVELAP